VCVFEISLVSTAPRALDYESESGELTGPVTDERFLVSEAPSLPVKLVLQTVQKTQSNYTKYTHTYTHTHTYRHTYRQAENRNCV
jgi:hypothetical protein